MNLDGRAVLLAAATTVIGTVCGAEDYAGTPVLANNGVGVLRFSGIRFAESPVGDWRWRAPRPVGDTSFDVPVYRFDRIRAGEHGIGAYHGAEIPYVFDTHDA